MIIPGLLIKQNILKENIQIQIFSMKLIQTAEKKLMTTILLQSVNIVTIFVPPYKKLSLLNGYRRGEWTL